MASTKGSGSLRVGTFLGFFELRIVLHMAIAGPLELLRPWVEAVWHENISLDLNLAFAWLISTGT